MFKYLQAKQISTNLNISCCVRLSMYGLMNFKVVLNCSEDLIEMNKFQLRKCLSISNDYHILFVWNILYNCLDLVHYALIFGMETGSVYMGIGLSRPRHHCFKCLQPSSVSRNLLFIHFWKDDMFSELLYFDVFIVAKIDISNMEAWWCDLNIWS